MPINKNAKIGIAVIIIAAVAIPLGIYGYIALNRPNYPSYNLTFYGNIDQNKTMSYADIMTGNFNKIIDQNYTYVKNFNGDNTSSVILSGISLWDLIQASGVNYSYSNAIELVGIDGYASPEISLASIEANKDQVLVVYAEDGTTLQGPEQNGDGYLMGFVSFNLTNPTGNSKYEIHNLVGIRFLYPDLTFFGNVAQNETISYDKIMTHNFNNVTNANYTLVKNFNGDNTSTVVLSGINLWDLIQYSGVNYTNSTEIKFIGIDGWSSLAVNLTTVENDTNQVLVVYAVNGTNLEGPAQDGDGYLMSFVSYNITNPVGNSKYEVHNLVGIEFV